MGRSISLLSFAITFALTCKLLPPPPEVYYNFRGQFLGGPLETPSTQMEHLSGSWIYDSLPPSRELLTYSRGGSKPIKTAAKWRASFIKFNLRQRDSSDGRTLTNIFSFAQGLLKSNDFRSILCTFAAPKQNASN